MQKKSLQRTKLFDGKGGALAHAYCLECHNSRREIHNDEAEQ